MKLRRLLPLGILLTLPALMHCGGEPGGDLCTAQGCADAAAIVPPGDSGDETPWDTGSRDAQSSERPDASADSLDATISHDGALAPDASSSADVGSPADAADSFDAGPADASSQPGTDAGEPDASAQPGLDAGGPDAAAPPGLDAGESDAGLPNPCVSGAQGNIAVRFAWTGTGSGSRAYVAYDTNGLPDISRWKVGAYGSSIGYTPTFDDLYLGDGGLDLESGAFIDVELSTAGLTTLRRVTVAILGRSFATTASGSFSWQTFLSAGATGNDVVSNRVPYEWYAVDATLGFSAGDDGVLLRIRPGPSSNALIVNHVELCFDAD